MNQPPSHEIGRDDPVADAPDEIIESTGSMRRCIVTGDVLEKERLIRFALSPEGVVVPDVAERLPGRGLWVLADAAALKTAIAKNTFARAARRSVTVPPDLPDLVQSLLRQRLIDMIGFARRAGFAVAGFDKVETLAARKKLFAILIGSDAGKDGRRRLEGLAGATYFIDALDSRALGGIFGAIGIVVYAGISDKAHAQRLKALADRLEAVSQGGMQGHVASNGMIGHDERQ